MPRTEVSTADSSATIAEVKQLRLELGYADDNTVVGILSYPVLKLKDLGVTIPVLDLIEFNVGIGAGMKEIANENEFVWGVTVTLIKIKF